MLSEPAKELEPVKEEIIDPPKVVLPFTARDETDAVPISNVLVNWFELALNVQGPVIV